MTPPETKRVVEAMLFAARRPLAAEELAARLPEGVDVGAALRALADDYDGRGLVLAVTRGGYSVRTRPEASDLAARQADEAPRLSKAAFETLAAIASYDAVGRPLVRSEIERVRGVGLSPGVLDVLLSCGYVRPGRRRDTPGRPLTWVLADGFHDAFGLRGMSDVAAWKDMVDAGLAVLPPVERADETVEGDTAGPEGVPA